tara:strand:+ start:6244 stop:6531 length:288 start_codon:yes stop_codon:yes gene_type:complete
MRTILLIVITVIFLISIGFIVDEKRTAKTLGIKVRGYLGKVLFLWCLFLYYISIRNEGAGWKFVLATISVATFIFTKSLIATSIVDMLNLLKTEK